MTQTPWESRASSTFAATDMLSDDNDFRATDNENPFTYHGDYSAHMEELFEGDETGSNPPGEETDEDEVDFLYSGVDADTSSVSYKVQLRDLLGQDHEDGSESDALEVEKSLVLENVEEYSHPTDKIMESFNEASLGHSPSPSISDIISPGSRVSTPDSRLPSFKLTRQFLHPTVSRLRSYTPQSSRVASTESSVTSHSHLFDGTSTLLHSLSRVSSLSNPQLPLKGGEIQWNETYQDRSVFMWTELQSVTRLMFSKASQKASTVLGAPLLGSPTTMVTNGLICIGTTEGKVVVHDFKQSLLCVCESIISATSLGPVTALALSYDNTFLATGHSTGYIQLYNLKQPRNPVRSVPPTSLAAVSSGRKEGHLQGSKIISIGFVGERHTALVSADNHGLAFYHSLGKVLFVEAPDILRILGRYPDRLPLNTSPKIPLTVSSVPAHAPAVDTLQRKKSRYTVLAMAPLPPGVGSHATDNYHIVALLTPTKLVVVGLKPTPRTWFKSPRELDEGGSGRKSQRIGTLAWSPSRLQQTTNKSVLIGDIEKQNAQRSPTLAYSWGNSLHFIRVNESRVQRSVKNPQTGKSSETVLGIIANERLGKWLANDNILAIHWLNSNQLVVATQGTLGVYDLKLSQLIEQVPYDGLSLVSPATNFEDAANEFDVNLVSHSLCTHEGKVFFLTRDRVMVGTLLTWADRILALVETGEFLKAIDLARSYYTEEAPGNRNNLPDDCAERKAVIGDKMRKLMGASTQYAFSEDRMTDGTHVTPDHRGVDRTSLFEDLVTVCCSACIAMEDFEFLFEDLFQKYDDSGISSIYLRHLEPFVLNNEIRYVPPRITQRLVALHEQDGRPERIERIIWHMDPTCLDLNQAIHLCQQYHLYDALAYIYTRALRDYVAPIVELLGLIRKVKKFRKSRDASLSRSGSILDPDLSMESTIINAYKIYPYLANTLSGLTYPSEDPLSDEDAYQAKRDIFTFLFFGRSIVWPPGEGGKLVLTSDEDGGSEPTYPYVRQLLLFDSESLLHSLDIAFEDAYLNDESLTINRLVIVRILLEILSSGHLSQEDVTMVHIFVARNVPKYPQFLQIAPSTLHLILVGLADDPDPNNREDRQLAAEYLLSVYNPHDTELIIKLFETAGFFRILRTWYYHEHQWVQLLSTYVDDPGITSLDLLNKVQDVLSASSRFNKGIIPEDLITLVSNSLPRLLHVDITGTALFIDKVLPNLHRKALEAFSDDISGDRDRYEYLLSLLNVDTEDSTRERNHGPSENLTSDLQHRFFTLQCRFYPKDVIGVLRSLPEEMLEFEDILTTCQSFEVYDAIIWAIDRHGDPQDALVKGDLFQKNIARSLVESISAQHGSEKSTIVSELDKLLTIAQVSREVCLGRSRQPSPSDIPLEDMWFKLLDSQIQTVQFFAGFSGGDKNITEEVDLLLSSLRSLVQKTFSSLVSITSTSTVSFPRLFKRLVNSTPLSPSSQYQEFRTILTGMLESYRSDEDLLVMLKHLIDRDLYETILQATKEHSYGWASQRGTCQFCHKPLLEADRFSPCLIVVSRTGSVFHQTCMPHQIS